MKYNPEYHKNVVCNFCEGYKQRYGQDLTLPEETIWQIYETETGVVVEGHEDDPEYSVYDELHIAMNNH